MMDDELKNEKKKEEKNEEQTEKESIEEIGGPEGQEPTTYGDWQKNGRVSDF